MSFPAFYIGVVVFVAFVGFLFYPFQIHLAAHRQQGDRFLGIKLMGLGIRIFEFAVIDPRFFAEPDPVVTGTLSWRFFLIRSRRRPFTFAVEGKMPLGKQLALLYVLTTTDPASRIKHIIFHPFSELRDVNAAEIAAVIVRLLISSLKRGQALTCRHLTWETELGLGDAALTGFLSGLLWNIKGVLIAALSGLCSMETRPQLDIQPEYDTARFEFAAEGIFNLRLGHIITGSLYTVFRALSTNS